MTLYHNMMHKEIKVYINDMIDKSISKKHITLENVVWKVEKV